jgi:AbrB family looped-hinge helix DNA binding protein
MTITEKIIQKISSNGRIVIPKVWREKLALIDDNFVELELQDNTILIKKKIHPIAENIGLFDGLSDFTDEEFERAKKSLFKTEE